MNEQEKIVKEILNRIGDFGVEQENMIKFLERQIKKASVLAKKEMFDDKLIKIQFACLESWCKSRDTEINKSKIGYCSNCRRLNELKKRHLSTFAEQKEHNCSSKKDCLQCGGKMTYNNRTGLYYCDNLECGNCSPS